MRIVPFVVAMSLLGPTAALAKDSHERHPKHVRHVEAKHANIEGRHATNARSRHATERYQLPSHDVRVIQDYYSTRYHRLPPGLQKKLYRTGQLPPGWQRKIHPLPLVVERRLAPVPHMYRRAMIGDQVVVYDPRTHVVVDVTPAFVYR
jgi:hypothetical protein